MSHPSGVRRIAATFAAHAAQRPLLVAYLMAGYPDARTATLAAEEAVAAGADMLEIGIPFSDPVADGPLIQAAGQTALAGGAGLDTALNMARSLRRSRHDLPLLAMGYLNPLLAGSAGAVTTVGRLAHAGFDGLIVPDLPAGEDPTFERLVAAAGLDMAFLVAPNTSPTRLEDAIRASTAFVYVVPLYGVTGIRRRINNDAIPLLSNIRSTIAGRRPLGVGFGISSPAHVRRMARATDAIIVGSAIVAALEARGPSGVGHLVRELASALPRSSHAMV